MAITSKERLVRGAPRRNTLVGFPSEVYEALEDARQSESAATLAPITITEFITRAVIDRIGLVLGEGRANYLYRRYFNGIGYTEPANEPAISDPKPLGSIKPAPRQKRPTNV
jgi:hypothetical protein